MRPLIFVLAIVSLFAGSIAFAHGRHGGNAHASQGKSSALTGFNNDPAASAAQGGKPDAKPNADAAPTARGADTDKSHRKPGRAPDEEEVMQAEH